MPLEPEHTLDADGNAQPLPGKDAHYYGHPLFNPAFNIRKSEILAILIDQDMDLFWGPIFDPIQCRELLSSDKKGPMHPDSVGLFLRSAPDFDNEDSKYQILIQALAVVITEEFALGEKKAGDLLIRRVQQEAAEVISTHIIKRLEFALTTSETEVEAAIRKRITEELYSIPAEILEEIAPGIDDEGMFSLIDALVRREAFGEITLTGEALKEAIPEVFEELVEESGINTDRETAQQVSAAHYGSSRGVEIWQGLSESDKNQLRDSWAERIRQIWDDSERLQAQAESSDVYISNNKVACLIPLIGDIAEAEFKLSRKYAPDQFVDAISNAIAHIQPSQTHFRQQEAIEAHIRRYTQSTRNI